MPLNWAGYLAAVGARRAGLRGGAPAVRAASALQRLARRRSLSDALAEPPVRPARIASPGEFARIWLDCVAQRRIRPAWGPERVEWILAEAARRPSLGGLRLKAVDGPGGAVGCLAYHVDPLGRAICVAAVAKSGEVEATLRAVFADAEAAGCVAMLGQSDPALMEGLFRIHGAFYRHTSGALVGAARPEVVAAFASGEGTLGGLVGDAWTPLATEAYSDVPSNSR
ncbi:MAG: hypothetical protein KGQ28_06450, partial [Hyphomicrobiales bacterium]|nr:hypothetical protein [Hyphomicrobiales bacterium]